MAYRSYLIEVPEVNEVLEEINKENMEIVEVAYVSDSAQVLLICKEGRKGFIQTLKEKQNTEPEEGE